MSTAEDDGDANLKNQIYGVPSDPTIQAHQLEVIEDSDCWEDPLTVIYDPADNDAYIRAHSQEFVDLKEVR